MLASPSSSVIALLATWLGASSVATAPVSGPSVAFKPEFVGHLTWTANYTTVSTNTSVVQGSGTHGGYLTVHQSGTSYGGFYDGLFLSSSAQISVLNVTVAGATGTGGYTDTFWLQLQALNNDGDNTDLCLTSSNSFPAPTAGFKFVYWTACSKENVTLLAEQLWRADVKQGVVRFLFQGEAVKGKVGPGTNFALTEDLDQYGRIETFPSTSDAEPTAALWFHDPQLLN